MSLSDRKFGLRLNRIAKGSVLALGLTTSALALSACSFSPVYGTTAQNNFALNYAKPNSRLEQIIYQDLALGLGRSTDPAAPLVTIAASPSNRRVGRTSAGSPSTTYESIVSATATITRIDSQTGTATEVYKVTRDAAATYTTNGQSLADQQAAEDAEERAARAVAQSLRLLIAAKL